MKLRSRLILGLVLITGVGFFYLTNWIIKELRPHYLKAMEESLVDTATLLSSLLSELMNADTIRVRELEHACTQANSRTFQARIYDLNKNKMNLRVYVTDTAGVVIFDSDNGRDVGRNYSQWNDVARTLKGRYGARATRRDPHDPNSVVLFVGSPIMKNNRLVGALTVAKPAESVSQFIENAKVRIIIAGVISALGVLLFAALLSVWITEPIRKITDYIRSVRLNKHIPFPKLHSLGILGRNEMDELGTSLVEMQESLEKKQYVERYVQNLTHEIKSPLSAIQAATEIIDEKMPESERLNFLSAIRSESGRIQHIVDRMLELSLIENRMGLKSVEKIDLRQLFRETSDSMAVPLKDKNVTLLQTISPNLYVFGERFLLRQVIANLVQNALDFSSPKASICLAALKRDDTVTITVSDKGAGIPEYALSRIFERFYSLNRPDTNKRSTGLGLSFVKEAVELHNGTISITNNCNAPGVTAVVNLPIQPPEN